MKLDAADHAGTTTPPGDPLAAWLAGVAPVDTMTATEWAERYRILPPDSAEPGPWRVSRVPFVREILDAMVTPGVTMCVMKAAQLTITEAANNAIGYSADVDPAPILYLLPNVGMAREHSRKRIDPMFRDCERLDGLLSRRNGGVNTRLVKGWRGGGLMLAGSNSAAALSSNVIRRLYVDEFDRCARTLRGEGSVVDVALKRMITFPDGVACVFSTPTTLGDSPIAEWYGRSDRRAYFVRCPHCEAEQVLEWSRVRWPALQPHLAQYHCERCDEAIDEGHKPGMMLDGRWIPRSPGVKLRGYWISAMYSPFLRWRDLAIEWEEVRHDPERRRVFVNTMLAEPFDPLSIGGLRAETLRDLREPYTSTTVPAGAVLVTMATDVQADHLVTEWIAWGAHLERWHLDVVRTPGTLDQPATQRAHDELLARRFRGADGRELRRRVALIDSSFDTVSVYRYVRGREATRRIYAVKGRSEGPGAMPRPLWPGRRSSTDKSRGGAFYTLGVDVGKDDLRRALEWTVARRLGLGDTEPGQAGPGMVHWPVSDAYGLAYFEELLAESPVMTPTATGVGRQWVKREGARNEGLDLAVYGLAALAAWESLGPFDLEDTAAARAAPPPPPPPPPPPRRESPTRLRSWGSRR